MKHILFILSLGIVMSLVSGCGIFGGSKKDVEYLNPPKIVYTAPPTKKPPTREQGSLWSEESHWNEIYSPVIGRSLGDVIVLNLNPNFKNRVLTTMYPYRNFEQDKKEIEEAKMLAAAEEASKKDQKAGEGDASRAPASTAAAKNEPKVAEVTIIEVLSKGLYRVSANQGMQISDKNTFVSFEGTIKEKDIANDGSTNSDSLLSLKVEVVQPEKLIKKPVVASNGTPGKTDMTPPPAGDKK